MNQMNATTTRHELVTAEHSGNMAANSYAVGGGGGGGGGGGWSQHPGVVQDHGTAVQSELMQKASMMEQQSASMTSGRQNLNTASFHTVTTRTLSPTSNVAPLSAGRSDIRAHHHTRCISNNSTLPSLFTAKIRLAKQ